MDKKTIQKSFKKFKIPVDKLPEYTDPYKFAQNIKKCSILKDTPVYYSQNTQKEDEGNNA